MSFSNDLPEMQTYVKFFLEKLGAAFGIAQIFGSITVRFYLHAHRALLEGDSESSDALPVSMVQALGDAENRSEPACDAFVGVAQRGVRGVMASRFGLAVVIANQRGDDRAIAAFETGDVPIQRQVFAVLVVSAMADAVTGIVEQRASFEQNA